MSPTDYTNPNQDVSTKSAEREVEHSAAKFEDAMDMLADKVETTSTQVQNVVETVKQPVYKAEDLAYQAREHVQHLAERTREAMEPIMPHVRRAQAVGRQYVARVQDNPLPYFYTAMGVIGGVVLFRYLMRRRAHPSLTGDIDLANTIQPPVESRVYEQTSYYTTEI